ncbi:MAG: thymidylate kinase, partial [Pygmaiobacter sp.]
VKLYLSGAFGEKAGDVNAYAASTFYAVDRFASFRSDWGSYYAQGGVLVCDRYTTSNAVHQCSKLPRSEWDAYLDWLFDFEYNKIGIPAPDKVVLLDLPLAVSQTLMSARYQGDEAKKDIHENDLCYLEKSHEAAVYCAEKFGWSRIDCTENGQLLPIDAIHEKVTMLVKQWL